MAFKTVFQRYEMKYLIRCEEKEAMLSAIKPYMEPDSYGRSTVRNLYYDTASYRLIRESIERPSYKEKLRIRSYKASEANDTVFVELKKKFEDVVCKRRIALPYSEAEAWISGKAHCTADTQIVREIDYFMEFYGALRPTVFLSYEREAYNEKNGGELRVTFDDSILYKQDNFTLSSDIYGTPLLPPDTVLMEIKCTGSMPIWLARVLSENKIFKTSFSKYGTAYMTALLPSFANTLNKYDNLGGNTYDKTVCGSF